jgi:hypothetical protein
MMQLWDKRDPEKQEECCVVCCVMLCVVVLLTLELFSLNLEKT